jgi:hypothetical protein
MRQFGKAGFEDRSARVVAQTGNPAKDEEKDGVERRGRKTGRSRVKEQPDAWYQVCFQEGADNVGDPD